MELAGISHECLRRKLGYIPGKSIKRKIGLDFARLFLTSTSLLTGITILCEIFESFHVEFDGNWQVHIVVVVVSRGCNRKIVNGFYDFCIFYG